MSHNNNYNKTRGGNVPGDNTAKSYMTSVTNNGAIEKRYKWGVSNALESGEINRLRENLVQNIGFLNLNRRKVPPNEYAVLVNYHEYALNTLNNMLKIQEVGTRNSFSIENLVYNTKGILEERPRTKNEHREEWEHQFDANLVNPPCYTLPPSGCFKPGGPIC